MTQIYALSGSHGAKAQLSFVGTGHAVAVTGRRGPAGEPALPGEALLGGGVRGEGEPQTLPTALRTGCVWRAGPLPAWRKEVGVRAETLT